MSEAASKRSKPLLRRGARVHEVAHAALGSALEQIVANTPGARAGDDIEATHQLRVGVRRLRVALRAFEKIVGEQLARELAGELKWLFQRLGTVREYDVLLSTVVQPLQRKREPPAFAPLVKTLTRERDKAARAAKAALASRRFAKLTRSLRQLATHLELQDEPSPRARKWARKRLERRLEAVRSLRTAAFGDDEVARHELRKELKKLRYLAELVRGVWPKQEVKRYLKRMARLQDALGELTDAHVHEVLLARAGAQLGRGGAKDVQACLAQVARSVQRSERKLAPAFAEFERVQPFWE